MSAALRAYAAREAATRSEEQSQQQQDNGDTSIASTEIDAPFTGKKVLISGLLARPDLNGQTGECTSFSTENSRYAVTVNGEQIALRATNLSIAKSDLADADAFATGARVKLKDLKAKADLNGCGGTVVEFDESKGRFVVEIDGSMQRMLLKAANLERDRRERWAPEMHTAANLAHINAEMDRYVAEQAKTANPFVGMFGEDGAQQLMQQEADRKARQQEEEDAAARGEQVIRMDPHSR